MGAMSPLSAKNESAAVGADPVVNMVKSRMSVETRIGVNDCPRVRFVIVMASMLGVWASAELPTDVEPVDIREHEIQDHEIVVVLSARLRPVVPSAARSMAQCSSRRWNSTCLLKLRGDCKFSGGSLALMLCAK